MKITLEFLKDMGVCKGALAAVTEWFEMQGITEGDMDELFTIFKADATRDYLETFNAKYNEAGHNTIQGWYDWCDELPTRPEALMYFNDYKVLDVYQTSDGKFFSNLEAAEAAAAAIRNEGLEKHYANIQTGTVHRNEKGDETFRCFDCNEIDHNCEDDEYMLYDPVGNKLMRTPSPTMVAIGVAQLKDTQDRQFGTRHLRSKIADESGKYEIWITL